MTARLYYDDCYLTRFEARVVERADNGRRVYLDRSAFYPTSGGQQFDTGTLCLRSWQGPPSAVIDVVDEGERVAHLLDAALPEGKGDQQIVGVIDRGRRFDHMQQHSGQHLLSAVIQQQLGLSTTSVHFGPEACTLDLDGGLLDEAELQQVEAEANAIITDNRAISATQEDASTAEGLRGSSKRTGPLRIVSIADLDRNACGGTHVARTGEIGVILIRKQERMRKAARLEFVCGARAVRRARADYLLLTSAAGALGSPLDAVATATLLRLSELNDRTTELRKVQETLQELRASELHRSTPRVHGLRRVLHQQATGSLQEAKGLAQAFTTLPGTLFVASVAAPASLLIASSTDSDIDAGAELRLSLTHVGGKGGGSARLAQGRCPTAADLDRALDMLRERLFLSDGPE